MKPDAGHRPAAPLTPPCPQQDTPPRARRDRRRQPLLMVAVLVAAVLLSACSRSSQPVTFAAWVTPDLTAIQRVVVVPFQTPAGSPSASLVGDTLAAALRRDGRFEVMVLDPAAIPALSAPGAWESNRLPPTALRELHRNYNCDAVLIGRVDRWRSYDPVAIGVQTHLVRVDDGLVVWSAGGDFDAGTHDVQAAIKRWWQRTGGDAQASVSGWRIALASPRIFADWLAANLLTSLDDDQPGSGEPTYQARRTTHPHR